MALHTILKCYCLNKISESLNVPVSTLLGEEQQEEVPIEAKKRSDSFKKDRDNVMSIMAINSLKSKKSQNFDVIHELFHYWLHPAGEHLCYESNFIFQNKGI